MTTKWWWGTVIGMVICIIVTHYFGKEAGTFFVIGALFGAYLERMGF